MDIERLISNVGFPIVAYILLYFRLEKKLDKLIEALENVTRPQNSE